MEVQRQPYSFSGELGPINCHMESTSSSKDALAVLLPGAGYSYREPLLRFALQVLLQKQFKVLVVETLYGEIPAWTQMTSESDARGIVERDSVELFKAIPEQTGFQVHTVVARSLGTFALACALEQKIVHPHQIIWQTPALRSKWEAMQSCDSRSFGILGTKDFYFEKAKLALPREHILIEGADHAMEAPGNPIRSIEFLKQITEATTRWLEPAP